VVAVALTHRGALKINLLMFFAWTGAALRPPPGSQPLPGRHMSSR
jgi:hypothetical protein